ncbi:MAG: hypothetical protein WB755_21505 [Terriglobales bacterium]
MANWAVTRLSLWLFFCDQTGAVAVITNNATNISQVSRCDHHDQYFFAGLRPTVHAGGHAAQLSVGS